MRLLQGDDSSDQPRKRQMGRRASESDKVSLLFDVEEDYLAIEAETKLLHSGLMTTRARCKNKKIVFKQSLSWVILVYCVDT
jgi:hypothetical protein